MKRLLSLLILGLVLVGCGQNDPETPPEKPFSLLNESGNIPFTLLGVDYELPVSYKTLEENGWEAQYSLEDVMESNTFIKDLSLRKGPYIIEVSFYNNQDHEIQMADALIAEIAAENRTWDTDIATDITAPKDVDFESKYESIEALYGAPTSTSESVALLNMEYTISERASITYKFNLNDEPRFGQSKGDMHWMVLKNYKAGE